MWNCALKSFNAENCGSTLLIGDENNLSELADISVNILKLPTEDPTNPENMGMLVMLNGFGECMQKYFQLEQVAFNMSRDMVYSDLTAKMINFHNQNVINQTRIDELARKDVLTTLETEEFATNLGFQNSETMTTFHNIIMDDMEFLYNNYLEPASNRLNQQSIILNMSDRYISSSSGKLVTGIYFDDVLVKNIKNINSVVEQIYYTHPAVCKVTYLAAIATYTEEMISGNIGCAELDFVPQIGLTCHGIVTGVYLVGVANATYLYRQCLNGK